VRKEELHVLLLIKVMYMNKFKALSITEEGLCHNGGQERGAYRVLVGNLKERSHLDGSGVDGRIILKWILNK
jgi:hypothetical protein